MRQLLAQHPGLWGAVARTYFSQWERLNLAGRRHVWAKLLASAPDDALAERRFRTTWEVSGAAIVEWVAARPDELDRVLETLNEEEYLGRAVLPWATRELGLAPQAPTTARMKMLALLLESPRLSPGARAALEAAIFDSIRDPRWPNRDVFWRSFEAHQPGAYAAFCLEFDRVVVVEFSETGNAAYLYGIDAFREWIEPRLASNKLSGPGDLKDTSRGIPLRHASGWQYKFRALLRSYEVRPGPDRG